MLSAIDRRVPQARRAGEAPIAADAAALRERGGAHDRIVHDRFAAVTGVAATLALDAILAYGLLAP